MIADDDMPKDYAQPDWGDQFAMYNWKNHVGERTKSIWNTLTDEQKRAIAADAEHEAGEENWDRL